jgi:oligoribonuclease
VPKTADAPSRGRQRVGPDEGCLRDRLDHKLGDAVAPLYLVRRCRIQVDEDHGQLVTVSGVDEPGTVEDSHAVAQGQAAARLNEAGVSLRDGDRDPGGDEGAATARRQHGTRPGHEVGAGIRRPGVGGQRQVGIELEHRDGKHADTLPAPPLVAAGRVPCVLAWMDLEMTGLDPTRNTIVEIATLVTDDDLEVVAEGPDLVIAASSDDLARMEDVVKTMHSKSGLLAAIESSTTTLADAGRQTLEFLKQHIPEARSVPLCGNSIATDRRFLVAHLPEIEEYLHYRSVDVSTIKELARRWYPDAYVGAPRKAGGHRALDDIKESVTELRYYRTSVFKPPA